MKKYFILLSLLVLPFAFTSCGSDDDNNDNNFIGKALTDPALKAAADEYYKMLKEDNPELGAIDELVLKLTEDGLAEVWSKGGRVAEEATRRLLAEGEEYVTIAKYTKEGDVYTIEGVGTFSVKKTADNKASISLNFGENLTANLVAEVIKSGINPTTLVNQVCRTWQIIQTNIAVKGGDLGNDSYSKNFVWGDASNLKVIADDIDGQDKLKNVRMKDNLGDRYTSIQDVTLSRNGSIIIRYTNGLKDVGTISRIADNGEVTIDWENELYSNQYLVGDIKITATIESNCLRLSFFSNVEAENVPQPYEVQVEFTMQWAN